MVTKYCNHILVVEESFKMKEASLMRLRNSRTPSKHPITDELQEKVGEPQRRNISRKQNKTSICKKKPQSFNFIDINVFSSTFSFPVFINK